MDITSSTVLEYSYNTFLSLPSTRVERYQYAAALEILDRPMRPHRIRSSAALSYCRRPGRERLYEYECGSNYLHRNANKLD